MIECPFCKKDISPENSRCPSCNQELSINHSKGTLVRQAITNLPTYQPESSSPKQTSLRSIPPELLSDNKKSESNTHKDDLSSTNFPAASPSPQATEDNNEKSKFINHSTPSPNKEIKLKISKEPSHKFKDTNPSSSSQKTSDLKSAIPLKSSSSGPKGAIEGKKQFQLVIYDFYGNKQQSFKLKEGINIVGVASPKENHYPDVDLTFVDTNRFVSRRHAEIIVQNGRLFVRDLGSRNGTEVRGQLISGQPVEVECGELVVFARVRCKIIEVQVWE